MEIFGQLPLDLAVHPAGRLITVGRGEVAYRAFVPDPLPPAIGLTATLWRGLSEADRAIGELNGLGRTLPNPDLLIGPFVHREAVLSSKIEGTRATIVDLYAAEAGQARGAGGTDVHEVANYLVALRYGLERLSTLPVSQRLVRELHERLMRGVRGDRLTPGEYRASQNWTGRPGCTLHEATYVPPPTSEMETSMNSLEMYLHVDHDPTPPLVRLALVHAQFEMIHPFLDGNGRIGRLLVSLLMVHWQLLSLPLLYLSAYFERDRDAYYEHLLAISRDGAWAAWIEYFLRGVRDEAHDASIRTRRLQDLQAEWRVQMTGARSSTLLLRLIDELFRSPIISITRAQELLGVTYPAARNNIDKLVAAGILAPFGARQYGRTYVADRILDTIGK